MGDFFGVNNMQHTLEEKNLKPKVNMQVKIMQKHCQQANNREK